MTTPARNVALLGSTGSIGCNTLEVIDACQPRFRAVALSANRNLDRLLEQAKRLKPRWLIATDPAEAAKHDWSSLPRETELLVGPEGVRKVVSQPEVDLVVAAIVGSAGLTGAWAALEA